MTMLDLNQKAVGAGHNNPPDEAVDWGALTGERLNKDYAPQVAVVAELEAEEQGLPDEITDDATALRAGGIIKRGRDLYGTFEDKRVVEGTPSLRIKNAIDGFFNGWKKRIEPDKSERRTNPGLIDRVQAKITTYQNKKEAAAREALRLQEEQAKREREAAEKEARDKKAEADRLAAKAQEELAAAERARNPERIEEKTNQAIATAQQATQAAAAAAAAVNVAEKATERAQDARIAGLAPAKDIVRTQGVTAAGAGVTLTKATEKIAELVDRSELTDPAKLLLFEHLTDDQVAMAVRKYANATGHRAELPGCLITIRKKDVTR